MYEQFFEFSKKNNNKNFFFPDSGNFHLRRDETTFFLKTPKT